MKNQSFKFSLFSFLVIGFMIFTAASCQQKETLDFNPLLLNCWTHSYEEEDNAAGKVYRPCDFMEFPLSRYRSTYTLKENQECEYLVLAPNDAHYFEKGSWEFLSETNVIIIRNTNDEIVAELEILELEEELLMISTN